MEKEQLPTAATDEEAEFTELALETQLVSQEQIRECIEVQKKLAAEYGKPATLPHIMVQKQYLTEVQANLILKGVSKHPKKRKGEDRERVGNFEIVGKLGEGGMGTVYEARHIDTNELVALKLLPVHLERDKSVVERFRREAEAGLRLNHPNIVRCIDFGDAEGQCYFVMEYVDGEPLSKILHECGTLAPEDVIDLMEQLIKALAHAHENGLVHRDIKPDNIMITRDGTVKLADLGLVKEIDPEIKGLTESGATMGTPYYMSPEQARDSKRIDHRSDIYSLGATIYHALSGNVPFEGSSSFEIMKKHESESLVPPHVVRPSVPKAFSRIVQKMMAKNPDHRHQDVEELLHELNALKMAEALRLKQAEKRLKAERRVRTRKKVKRIAIVVAILLVIVLGYVLLTKLKLGL